MNEYERTIHNAQIDIECAKLEIKYQRALIMAHQLFKWREKNKNILLVNKQFDKIMEIIKYYDKKKGELWAKKI